MTSKRLATYCCHDHCPNIVPAGKGDYCDDHKRTRNITTTDSGLGSKWQKQRVRILERDHYQCQIRGPGCTHKATTVDHIIPRAVAGAGLVPDSELRAACQHCNSSEGGKLSGGSHPPRA